MKRLLITTLLITIVAPPIPAQDCCLPCGQEYRLECQTVYEEQPITTRRLVTETVVEQKQVVSYRPVWETSTRERRYTVSKPVVETSTREERRTVMKPVWEVRYRDESYTTTRYVAETSSREERRTVMKPVTETQIRQEQRVVQRPVTETVVQDQVTTALRPVVSFHQRQVDLGGFQDQVAFQPGDTRTRLRWMRSQCIANPTTGRNEVLRAGFYWVPQQNPGTFVSQKVYVPNPTTQTIAQTSLVPEQIVNKVPVTVTRMESEVQVREVPVSIVRMQAEEQVRTVPVTVQRPVVETVPKFVPEYRCRYVPEEHVRTVPVTTQKFVTEERVEQIPVRTCRYETEYKTVEVPTTQSRWVTETSMRTVARKVWVKIPIDNGITSYTIPTSYVLPRETSYRVISSEPAVDATPTTVNKVDEPALELQPATPTPAAEMDESPANNEDSLQRGTPPILESHRQGWRSAHKPTSSPQPVLFRISSL